MNRKYPLAPISRVSAKHPCAICRKTDWCSYTTDGTRALCMRESAGSVTQARNGAHVHILTPDYVPTTPAIVARPVNSRRADADQLHEVYTYLLAECLRLSPEHADHLLNERGLSDTTIAANLYASIPNREAWLAVCAAMQERFGDKLHGIPGFYRRQDGRWIMPRQDGFFLPARDADGRIVGLQIRRDTSAKPKYLWHSTPPNKFPFGTSSGAPVHFVKPDLARRSGFAVITEGALKADRISEFSGEPCVALAGASAFNHGTVKTDVLRALPELRSVALAYDVDWKEKPEVKGALFRMIGELEGAGLKVRVREWEKSLGKGFDDLLFGRERIAA